MTGIVYGEKVPGWPDRLTASARSVAIGLEYAPPIRNFPGLWEPPRNSLLLGFSLSFSFRMYLNMIRKKEKEKE